MPPPAILGTWLRRILDLGALGPLAAFLVIMPAVGAAALAATSDAWFPPLTALGDGAAPVFVLATVVLAGLSLTPTHASSLVAGLLFGPWTGSLLALLGITGAAWFGYGLLRRMVRERALQQLERSPRAAAVHRALVGRGVVRTVAILMLVRLSPVMPFAGTNLLLAASGVRLSEFLLGSILGLAPRIVAVAVAGAGLARLDLSQGGDARLAVLGIVGTVALLVVLGRIARRALADAANVDEGASARRE